MGKGIILFDIDKTILDTEKTSELHRQQVLKTLNHPNLNEFEMVKNTYKESLAKISK